MRYTYSIWQLSLQIPFLSLSEGQVQDLPCIVFWEHGFNKKLVVWAYFSKLPAETLSSIPSSPVLLLKGFFGVGL